MAEAADLVGHARQRHRRSVIHRVEPGEDLVEQLDVLLDQLALGLALFGLAEDIERAATGSASRPDKPRLNIHSPYCFFCGWPVTGSVLESTEARLYFTE